METKKILVPTIIAIATLVVMTVGATYAFFQVGADASEFGTTAATATTGEIGGVSLTKAADSTLSLNVTATQMLQQENDVTYYATSSATPKTIGNITVTGAGTYSCTYSIEVTQATAAGKDKNLYEKFQTMEGKSEGQIYYTIDGDPYDFNAADLFNGENNIHTKTVTGLTAANGATITSNIVLVNKNNVDQTILNNSGVTLTYSIDSFECELTSN